MYEIPITFRQCHLERRNGAVLAVLAAVTRPERTTITECTPLIERGMHIKLISVEIYMVEPERRKLHPTPS